MEGKHAHYPMVLIPDIIGTHDDKWKSLIEGVSNAFLEGKKKYDSYQPLIKFLEKEMMTI